LIIATVLLGSRRIRDVPYTGDRSVDGIGAFLSVVGMGGLVVGVLVWQEGGESVALLLTVGVAAMAALVYWLRRRKREGKAALLDPGLFASKPYRLGVFQIFLQQVALGGMLIAGNPQHQHRRPAPLPSGCSDRHPPRRSHRSRQRIPHDAPTRTTAVDRLGGCSPRLNLRRGPGGLDCSPHARETQEVAVRFQRVFAAARFESWVTCGPDLGRGGRRRATSGCVDAVNPRGLSARVKHSTSSRRDL
jgi:hypothetical protein